MARDEDQTLIDIRFSHDVFDPHVHPDSFSPDIPVNGKNHLDIESPFDLKAPTLAGFVAGMTLFAVAYALWILVLSA